jgi:hypothetical protein
MIKGIEDVCPNGHRTSPPELKGALFGFDIVPRNSLYLKPDGDPHATVLLYVEDDEVWHQQLSFSSAWVADLETLVKRLKQALADDERFQDDRDGCGREFK